MIIVGLDLSLTSTGVARHHTDTGRTEVATIQSKPTDDSTTARSLRLRTITGRVARMCAGADLVLVEGPAYASDVGKMWDRAGCWWLVVARLTATNIPVVEVTPNTIKTYSTGKGNASKDTVLAAVIRRYPDVPVSNNDEADSLIACAIGARYVGHPFDDLPQTHLRAVTAVRHWPTQHTG